MGKIANPKKINDIQFEAKFHCSEKTIGQLELSLYSPINGALIVRAAEQYLSVFHLVNILKCLKGLH